jgi:hypothetical protein
LAAGSTDLHAHGQRRAAAVVHLHDQRAVVGGAVAAFALLHQHAHQAAVGAVKEEVGGRAGLVPELPQPAQHRRAGSRAAR